MTALDGAVTFSQVNNMAKFVTHDLKFHMTCFSIYFDELNKAFPPDNLYKGYHLIAVDGSEMQIPLDFSDPDTLHKSASKGKFLSAFHLNVSYDVLNHRYLDTIVQGDS